jgi:hypothetical protein
MRPACKIRPTTLRNPYNNSRKLFLRPTSVILGERCKAIFERFSVGSCFRGKRATGRIDLAPADRYFASQEKQLPRDSRQEALCATYF